MSELLYDSQNNPVIKMTRSDHEKETADKWPDYLGLILREYRNFPDSHILSIGDWSATRHIFDGTEIPVFRAFMRLELGELRKMESGG